jgi:hypothetical protein
MKYVKMLGLLAVAAAALMAFAGTASATTVTGPNGETTPTIHAVHEGSHVILNNPIAKIECNSTVEGTVASHGAGLTVFGPIGTLNFTNCTNSWHVTVVTSGSLELHYSSPGVGTLTSSGATVTTTRFGIVCNYATGNTHIGAITDSSITGGGATLHINAQIPIHSGSSAFCGSGASGWSGSYVTTQKLFIDA